MTLHFAYGSNMSRALMAARCQGAAAVGIAVLSGWRFVINPEGFGSIAPRPGYIPLVVEAAREWQLPEIYIRSLARWAPSRWRGVRAKVTGDVG